jgi:hypothetical protein
MTVVYDLTALLRYIHESLGSNNAPLSRIRDQLPSTPGQLSRKRILRALIGLFRPRLGVVLTCICTAYTG